MSGQDELEKINELRENIKEQMYFISQLKSTISGVSGIDYDKEAVQTSVEGNPMLKNLCKIETEEEKLDKMLLEWITYRVKMIQKIHKMKVGILQRILYWIYIDDKPIKTVADLMHWTYDHTRKLHRQALVEFENIR